MKIKSRATNFSLTSLVDALGCLFFRTCQEAAQTSAPGKPSLRQVRGSIYTTPGKLTSHDSLAIKEVCLYYYFMSTTHILILCYKRYDHAKLTYHQNLPLLLQHTVVNNLRWTKTIHKCFVYHKIRLRIISFIQSFNFESLNRIHIEHNRLQLHALFLYYTVARRAKHLQKQ